MEIYLIRHTTPTVEKGICYGQSDLPLANTFEEDWKLLMPQLPHDAAAIYSSPLQRCSILAYRVKEQTSLPLYFDDRLKELNFGDWELKKWNEIDEPSLNQWMNNYEFEKCPNGESYDDLRKRVNAFLKAVPNKAIVITHGGVIKSTLHLLTTKSLREVMEQNIPFGSLTVLNYNQITNF